MRILLLLVSVTYKLPELSNANADGWLNWADVPVPSCKPLSPGYPATSLTILFDRFILRIKWFPLSAKNRFPELSKTNPDGVLRVANWPIPDEYPLVPFPPIVITIPPGVILRIRLFCVSDIYILAVESITIPEGVPTLAELVVTLYVDITVLEIVYDDPLINTTSFILYTIELL